MGGVAARRWSCALLLATLLGSAVPSASQPTPAPPKIAASPAPPKVEDLGHQRYRLGAIELDKRAGKFTVPATILRREPPLEFLAIMKGGYKAYESLISVDATAVEFNLACILIGLDASLAKPSRYHFDPQPALGDPVEVRVALPVHGKTSWVDAARLIKLGDQTLAEHGWRYTGSVVTPAGQYLAQNDGTLIGFVHDPATIIEHQTGILGKFGLVTANPDLVPAVGTRIMLSVERPAARGGANGKRVLEPRSSPPATGSAGTPPTPRR